MVPADGQALWDWDRLAAPCKGETAAEETRHIRKNVLKVQHSPPSHMQVGVDGGRLQRPDGPHVQPKRWGELCIWLSPPLVRERHGRNPRAVINSNGGITKPNNHALGSTSGSRYPARWAGADARHTRQAHHCGQAEDDAHRRDQGWRTQQKSTARHIQSAKAHTWQTIHTKHTQEDRHDHRHARRTCIHARVGAGCPVERDSRWPTKAFRADGYVDVFLDGLDMVHPACAVTPPNDQHCQAVTAVQVAVALSESSGLVRHSGGPTGMHAI